MAIRLNVSFLLVLMLLGAGLRGAEPRAALDPESSGTQRLAAMEDLFATERGDIGLARSLADAYLERDRPGLAIAVLRAADPTLLDDPLLSHRMAKAYEKSGRLLDALATAELALARCGRSLGTGDSSVVTALPRFACTARDYTALELHRSALDQMVRWGVTDPRTDPRAVHAHRSALRRARVASID